MNLTDLIIAMIRAARNIELANQIDTPCGEKQ